MKKISLLLMFVAMIVMAACTGSQKPAQETTDATAQDSVAEAKPVTKTIACKVFLNEGQEKAFMAIAQPLVDSTRMEPGNVSYDLYQSPTEPTAYFFFEVYQNDDAFQAHANSSHFNTFAAAVKPLLAKDLEISQY